ncbi:hypothetical protein HK103_004732 [Boothiomyces macroporosus]|uniref:RRM domain-containing protein n=1 Tax=Boothiomyces macroporosus TaxID=261099 RepID=A0AAD5Y6R7_9FUNG|nr:hypothetical protein HK103_004732 [Boothiomyces macroporosus]
MADLPTAPAASLNAPYEKVQSRDPRERETHRAPLEIPNNPPYTVYIGNLSYNVTEQDIERFFGDLHIKGIRMIMDIATNKPKGFGYVEFDDRDSLVAAIAMDGESLMNRAVRLNVAEGSKSKPASQRFEDSKFSSNWRERPAGDAPRPFRDSYSKNREDAFARRDERKDRPFARKPEADATPLPPRAKVNPFGQAAPRDEYAIQQAIEERRAAREVEKEKERKEKEDDKKKSKFVDAKKKPDNVPVGTWRRKEPANPNSNPTPAEDKRYNAFGGKKDDKPKAKKPTTNVYDLLSEENQ